MTEGTPAAGADPAAVMRSRGFVGLLLIAAVVGVVASFAAWCFLELIYLTQRGIYHELPGLLGFAATPDWWSMPVLLVAGLVTALAIVRLPGGGGHIPVKGLDPTPMAPSALPGVLLAAVAGIGFGIVLGPEAPLLALGGGIGLLSARRLGRDPSSPVATVIGTSGTFAALSFLFGSPLIAAVLLVEAAGLGGASLTLVLIPGLVAGGIGSLISVGMGSWTGLDTADISIELLDLPTFPRPELADFLWAIPLAAAIAVGVIAILALGRATLPFAQRRPFAVLPAIGVLTGVLALLFALVTDRSASEVLFSGQDALDGLVTNAAGWSLGALALLLALKGIAYGLALGSFRGGPVFPAMFLGSAAGIAASHLPGFELAPAVAVGLGAAVVAVLRMPLSALVLATLLTSSAGLGLSPVVIVGVAVAFVTVSVLSPAPAKGDRGEAPAGAT